MLQSGTLWMVLLGSNSVTCIQTHVTDAADTCTCPGGWAWVDRFMLAKYNLQVRAFILPVRPRARCRYGVFSELQI